MGAVFKRKHGAVIGALPIRDVLGDMLATLVMASGIPVLAIPAAVHVLTAVGTGVRPLHFDSVKIDLIIAFIAKMMSLFYFRNIHGSSSLHPFCCPVTPQTQFRFAGM